jgi:DNA-directed RNA polymerase subunit H (RpoH/RPB5)
MKITDAGGGAAGQELEEEEVFFEPEEELGEELGGEEEEDQEEDQEDETTDGPTDDDEALPPPEETDGGPQKKLSKSPFQERFLLYMKAVKKRDAAPAPPPVPGSVIRSMIHARGFLPMASTQEALLPKNTSATWAGRDGVRRLLILCTKEKFGITGARLLNTFFAKPESSEIKQLVVVASAGVTPVGRKTVSSIANVQITFFSANDLQTDFSKHVLVPRHRLLSEDEARASLKKHKATKQQLPKITTGDVQAKFYGWKAGDVIEVCLELGDAKEHINMLRAVVA